MEYKHFLTAIVGGSVVAVAILAEYGITAATVIFCTQWALVCLTWFITTLPGMNSLMRGTAWVLFMAMILLLGRQIPYMISAPGIGHSFCSFMLVMFVFLSALISMAHIEDFKKCDI